MTSIKSPFDPALAYLLSSHRSHLHLLWTNQTTNVSYRDMPSALCMCCSLSLEHFSTSWSLSNSYSSFKHELKYHLPPPFHKVNHRHYLFMFILLLQLSAVCSSARCRAALGQEASWFIFTTPALAQGWARHGATWSRRRVSLALQGAAAPRPLAHDNYQGSCKNTPDQFNQNLRGLGWIYVIFWKLPQEILMGSQGWDLLGMQSRWKWGLKDLKTKPCPWWFSPCWANRLFLWPHFLICKLDVLNQKISKAHLTSPTLLQASFNVPGSEQGSECFHQGLVLLFTSLQMDRSALPALPWAPSPLFLSHRAGDFL